MGERLPELIEGELVETGASSWEYGRAQAALATVLGRRFNRRTGGRWPGGWSLALAVDIYFDPKNTLRPDIAGWRRERMAEPPPSGVVKLVPDWACEVLSTNRRNDLVRKKRLYHRHHVPHYWIVDPAEQTLAVHRWGPDGYIEVLTAERGEQIRAEPFEAVELRVGTFFGDEDDDE